MKTPDLLCSVSGDWGVVWGVSSKVAIGGRRRCCLGMASRLPERRVECEDDGERDPRCQLHDDAITKAQAEAPPCRARVAMLKPSHC